MVILAPPPKDNNFTYFECSAFRAFINLNMNHHCSIQDYRLEELIFKDIKAYPNSGFSEIHQRIGLEINQFKVKRMLKNMVEREIFGTTGETRGMKYHLKQNLQVNV